MTGLDLIQTAVVAALAGASGKVLAAPIQAVADELTQRVRGRLQRTVEKAAAKGGGEVHQVHDRIAYNALREAGLTDDEIASDYLGGVLAASGPNDDSGAAIVALISRLAARDLLLHYVFYREVRRLWTGPPLAVSNVGEARKATISIPNADLERLYPGQELVVVLPSILPALEREGLVSGYRWEPDGGLTARPTGMGAALFLWGHGIGCPHATHLFEEEAHGQPLVFLAEVPDTNGASLVTPPEPTPAEAADPAP